MRVPPNPTPTQAPIAPDRDARTTAPPDALVLWPDDDAAPGPVRCPTCRRPWFDPRTSAVFAMVLLAQDVLADLKAALEEETLP